MDIAYESIMSSASIVWMGVRGGFLSFPKVLNNFRVLGTTFSGNLPIDGLITNLFETTYVHPWVSQSHLRWFVSDFVIKRVLWVLTGTQAGCNQWAGELPPERQGRAYVFLNKSAKAMQFINRPYYSLSWIHKLFAHYIDPPEPAGMDDPTIHMVPFPSAFDNTTGQAIFPPPPRHRRKEKGWREECGPDLVVLCTGYTQKWDWLGEGYPRGPDDCDVRGVCASKDLSVGFIGFLRPGVGESLTSPLHHFLSKASSWTLPLTGLHFFRHHTLSFARSSFLLVPSSFMLTRTRRNPSNGRTTNPTPPLPHPIPYPRPKITRNISSPSLTHRAHTIRRGLLDIHVHIGPGCWKSTWYGGFVEGVWVVCDFDLLVCPISRYLPHDCSRSGCESLTDGLASERLFLLFTD